MKKLVLPICFCFALLSLNAQHITAPAEGYSERIGLMVNMLEDLKVRITENVKQLNQEETDYLFDEQANSIGAIIMHITATEAYTQVETLEGRSWTGEEMEFWAAAGGLGDSSRESLKGKPISYYLELWDEVRQKTLEGLKAKDDEWFASEIDEGLNFHWAWFHVMEHTAAHMGQIDLVKSRLPK